MDVFIIIVSLGLATRFNQINQRLNTMRGQVCVRFVLDTFHI